MPTVEAEERPPRTELRPPSRGPWIVLAVAIIAGIAVVAAVWYRHRSTAPPATAVAPVLDAGQPEAAASGATSVEPGRARSLLESISENPLYRRAVQEGDVPRRWAVVTDNLAEGVSPRKQLEFLAPSRPFGVERRGDRVVIAAESYQRYDPFADAVASVGVTTLVKVYRELHGVIEAAYRALGYPGASLDRVSARALRRIAVAPVRDGEVAVERKGDLFLFTDPSLEGLGAVEKHLLRMGPRNTRAIQAKAREILAQLAPGAEQDAR